MNSQEHWMEKMTEEFQDVLTDAEEKAIQKISQNINAAMNYISDEHKDKLEDIADQYADGIIQSDLRESVNFHKQNIDTVMREALVQALQDNFRLRATEC